MEDTCDGEIMSKLRKLDVTVTEDLVWYCKEVLDEHMAAFRLDRQLSKAQVSALKASSHNMLKYTMSILGVDPKRIPFIERLFDTIFIFSWSDMSFFLIAVGTVEFMQWTNGWEDDTPVSIQEAVDMYVGWKEHIARNRTFDIKMIMQAIELKQRQKEAEK